MMWASKKTTVTMVSDGQVRFGLLGRSATAESRSALTLEQFLQGDPDPGCIPVALNGSINSLLVVPDYWFGHAVHKFQSRKRSLAEAFIQRKLQAEHPEQPDISDFFDFRLHPGSAQETELYAYYLQEPLAFQVYDRLTALNFAPRRITSPAFLWEGKLKREFTDFGDGGKGLIQLGGSESYLYFFYKGRFLFSRNITLPEAPADPDDSQTHLAYEINQSLHLFSQKAKADVNRFYLISAEVQGAQTLADILGRPVQAYKGSPKGFDAADVFAEDCGPLVPFHAADLTPVNDFLSLTHRIMKKKLEWRPVQVAGLTIGLIVLGLLGLENVVLGNWNEIFQPPASRKSANHAAEDQQRLGQYNEALDFLIDAERRRNPGRLLAQLARVLPSGARISTVTVAGAGIDFRGVVDAPDPEHIKTILSTLIDRCNSELQLNPPLRMADIDIGPVAAAMAGATGGNQYAIAFRMNLP